MNVLLINPNRYKSPPVPPIGLEYIASCLEKEGHKAEIIDLCFSEDLYKNIDNAMVSVSPDIVGITVRNVDTVLYHTNEFFLDEIKDIVNHVKSTHGLKVIVGGTGVLTNPEGILDYLEADFAIAGPAENEINKLLRGIQSSENTKKIYKGIYRPDSSCPRRPFKIDYKKYFDADGIAGFETHKGCSSSCVYCLEANSRVSFKNVEDVIDEIKRFVDIGYNHFHLCDSEFNESLEYSDEFCTALKNTGLDIKWAVYMKPANFNRKLFKLLKDTGVYLITLTVDSYQKCPEYWSDIERFVFSAKLWGIKIAVDFLTGFPHENENNVLEHLDFVRRIQPDSVGINTYIRLYKSLRITQMIMNDEKL
ncbi:MAG: cobalamin-dependent protein, partial [Nitrospirota bacterium]|nr:cobalamin-dependent protein [Nitrospirota bacterium]